MYREASRMGVEQVSGCPDDLRLGDCARTAPVHVGLPWLATATLVDGVEGCGVFCPPHGRGAQRLIHHHCSLLHRPTVVQRSDSDVRIMRHFV